MAEPKARPAANEWIPPSMANPDETPAPEPVVPAQPIAATNGSSASNTNGHSNGVAATVEALPVVLPNGAATVDAPNGTKVTVETHAVPNGSGTIKASPVAPTPVATVSTATAPVTPAPVAAVSAPVISAPAAPVAPAVKPSEPAAPKADEPAKKKRSIPIPLLVIVVFVGIYFVWHYIQSPPTNASLLSGTIEADEIHLASQIGGRVRHVYVNEGDRVQANQNLIDIYSMSGVNESITSPIGGVVLQRLIEPGEIALPNSNLIVVADLDSLSLTVYVPEDRYGQVQLDQSYQVTVDSFPGQTFSGRVSHIADQAEYTPKNVQTAEGRKSTVFGIKLELEPSGGKLKPGMPADVIFGAS